MACGPKSQMHCNLCHVTLCLCQEMLVALTFSETRRTPSHRGTRTNTRKHKHAQTHIRIFHTHTKTHEPEHCVRNCEMQRLTAVRSIRHVLRFLETNGCPSSPPFGTSATREHTVGMKGEMIEEKANPKNRNDTRTTSGFKVSESKSDAQHTPATGQRPEM